MKLKNKLIIFNVIIIVIIFLSDILFVNDAFVVNEFGNINVLFCPENNCSDNLIYLINNSNHTKCAFYDLKDKKIISIMNEKKTEVLVDKNNYNYFGKKIVNAGLMHNKFCIFDNKIVWTGSYNPTNSLNHNNVIIIESNQLAKNYLQEFQELKKGINKKTDVKKINFNTYRLENYFCPEDNCQEIIINNLNKANKSIYFLTFTFTDDEIAKIIILKQKNGLDVKGLMERFQNTYSVYPYLKNHKVNVVLDNEKILQHNKIFIIDNKTVITGSFNPTKAANTINDENILIIQEPKIVESYLKLLLILLDQNEGKSLSINPKNEVE